MKTNLNTFSKSIVFVTLFSIIPEVLFCQTNTNTTTTTTPTVTGQITNQGGLSGYLVKPTRSPSFFVDPKRGTSFFPINSTGGFPTRSVTAEIPLNQPLLNTNTASGSISYTNTVQIDDVGEVDSATVRFQLTTNDDIDGVFLTMISPSGNTFIILNPTFIVRTGASGSSFSQNMLFSSTAKITTDLYTTYPVVGTFKPVTSLLLLQVPAKGKWTFIYGAMPVLDTGTFNSITLTLKVKDKSASQNFSF